MRYSYAVPTEWIDQPIKVTIIGAGGTGGEVLDGLARMHAALLRLGHPYGFDVTIYDPDSVSPSNIGRQRFSPSDVGHNKALLLCQRLNLFYGLGWNAVPEKVNPHEIHYSHLIMTCVDTAEFRVRFAEAKESHPFQAHWLDFGNGEHTGQVVFGHINRYEDIYLPNVFDLFGGELRAVEDDDEPSCSTEEAFQHQDFGVNRLTADAGLGLLWNLLRHGQIHHHGAFIDVRAGSMQPLMIDTEAWAFFGWQSPVSEQAVEGKSIILD